MSSSSDADLVHRCLAGEDDAWEELVDRFARYVYAIAVRAYRLDAADAEDVFQETFARAYERLDSLRDADSLRPWLAQLARRQCVDRIRSLGRRPSDLAAVEAALAEPVLDSLEEAWDVRAALEDLSPDCQDVLDRFFCRDESYRTIGEAVGIPSGTIASRISRCLSALRAAVEGRSIVRSASGGQDR